MADDDDQTPLDRSIRDRDQAQNAASDLARMGIDPRSLGLGAPQAPRPSAPDPHDLDERAPVVYLRPELERDSMAPAVSPEFPDPVPSDLERQLSSAPGLKAPARQTGRLLRTVGRGLLTPDAAVLVQGERQIVDAVRQRQTDRRLVAFVAGKGGVGCTTVAVGVGTSFMAMRDDNSVVVDVQQGAASLGGMYGAVEPRTVLSLLAEVEASSPPVAASGLGLVDGASWDQPLTRADIAGALDRLRADHTFNLLDVGNDAGEGGHSALARADQAVIVTGPGETGIAAFRVALDRVTNVNPMAAGCSVHVIVCSHEQSFREAVKLTAGSQTTSTSTVVVPPDPHLQGGHLYDPALVTPATREAILRIAGAIAVRSAR